MFPHRKELYEGYENPIVEQKDSILALADPRVRDETIRKSGFDEDIFVESAVQRLKNGKSKNIGIVGLSHIEELGIEDLAMTGYYPTRKTVKGKETDIFGAKKARFSISSNEKGSTITVIPEKDLEYQRLLKMYKTNNGELSERAKLLIDGARRHDESDQINYFATLEPEQIDTLRAISNMYTDFMENNTFAAKYFAHLLSLNVHGSFADTSGMNYATLLTRLDDNPIIVSAQGRPPRKHPNREVSRKHISNEAKENLESMLNDFESNIFKPQEIGRTGNQITIYSVDPRRIIRAFDGLGKVFNYSAHSEPGSAISAIATEALITEIADGPYEDRRNDSFVDRLKRLNKSGSFKGLLDTFIGVYTQEGKTTPGNVRGRSIHNGGDHFFTAEGERTDVWASLFYIDLAKTVVSALAGKPTVFSDFDKYARNYGLVDTKGDNVAYIPLEHAGHYSRRND